MKWNYGGLFIFLILSTILLESILAYDKNRNNKKSLIFSTFPATFEEYIYKFDGAFEQWRFKQLQTIVKDKGSVQSNDTLEYEEFLVLMDFLNEYNNKGKNVEKMMEKMLPWNGENEKEKIDVEYLVKFVKEFREAYDVMDEQIQNFVEKFPIITNGQQYMENIDLLIECKKFMRFLMSEESKKGSRMANAGSWLDIFSFMDSGNEIFWPLKQIFECSKVQNASLDERINEELYEEHKSNRFKQKKVRFAQQDGDENQRQLDVRINPLERAVIEGAGPNGLMATFHLFLSGMRVLLVNDRPKKYIRSRIFLLDAKWMSQLRFFLGTMFDELFVGEKALADVNLGDVGFINCRNLEQKMWERLEVLGEFIQRKEANDEKILEVRSETLFNEKIEFPKEGQTKFFATFSTPTHLGNLDAGKENANKIKNVAPIIFSKKIKNYGGKITEEIKEKLRKESLKEAKQNMLDEILRNLLKVLSEMYRRKVGWYEKILEYQPDGRDGEKKKLNAKEWAKLELKGKVLQLKVHKKMQVDLVVCAGGAKDRIRDKYLGNAQLRIVPTNYAVFVLEKGKIGDKIFPQRTIFLDDTTMNDLKPFLDERNLNELIEQNDILSEKLRQKYKNMSELMTKTLIPKEVEEGQKKSPLNKEYKLDENGHFIVDKDEGKNVGQPIRIFENKESVLITSVPPFPLEEFLKELEKEKNSKPISLRPKYANLRKRLEHIWSAAIYDLSIEKIVRDKMETHKLNLAKSGELVEEEEGENGQKPAVYFNEYPVNTAIFQQTVLSVKNPVKELIMPEGKLPPSSSLIILAVGDANSNQHSLTASGLSTGRIGSEHIAYLIRDYHRGKMNRQQLVEELRASQNSVKERVLNRAMEFANLLPEEEDL